MDYSETAELEQLLQNEEAMLALGIGILIILGVMFIGWLFTLYPRYYMTKASGVGSRIGAFIPIWQDIQLFQIAGWKGWYFWIYLAVSIVGGFLPSVVSTIITIAGAILQIVIYWKMAANFGLGTAGKIFAAIPFTTWFTFWYIALKKKDYINSNSNNFPRQGQIRYQNNNAQDTQNRYQPQPKNPQQGQNWY